MNSKIGLRWLAVGLVAGLIIGSLAGYLGANRVALDALENTNTSLTLPDDGIPVETAGIVKFASEEGDESGEMGDIIMTEIGKGLVAYIKELGDGDSGVGIKKLVGEQQSKTFDLPQTLTQRLLNAAAERAVAQRACSGIEFGWAEKAIQSAYEYQFLFGNDVCTEEVFIKGELTVSIYEHEKDRERQQVAFRFNGEQRVTRWERQSNGTCVKVIETTRVTKSGWISVNANPPTHMFTSGLYPGYKLICRSIGKTNIYYYNPKFNKDKCCKPQRNEEPTE